MGALRAAELHVFGMQGVGRIFEAYRDDSLEDDDEVAVLHAPEEAGFLPLSEPMVNIRTTLARAEKQPRARKISPHQHGAATVSNHPSKAVPAR